MAVKEGRVDVAGFFWGEAFADPTGCTRVGVCRCAWALCHPTLTSETLILCVLEIVLLTLLGNLTEPRSVLVLPPRRLKPETRMQMSFGLILAKSTAETLSPLLHALMSYASLPHLMDLSLPYRNALFPPLVRLVRDLLVASVPP